MVQYLKEKLVRDRIPEILEANGQQPKVRVATGQELDLLLRKKIVEESTELLESGKTEEIADVLEAIESLIQIREIASGSLQELRLQKRRKRGGFTKGYVIRINESVLK